MANHTRTARALARQVLDPEAALEGFNFSQEEIDNLNAIAAGLPVKGAAQILSAIRLKADFVLQRPAQRVDMRAATVLVVQDPYALPEESAQPTLARPADAQVLPADRPRNLGEHKAQAFLQQREHLLLAAPLAAVVLPPASSEPEAEPA